MATMNVSLPDPLRDYVQNRIDSGQYASVSDYVRDLIRRDQSAIVDEERWLKELDASIDESLHGKFLLLQISLISSFNYSRGNVRTTTVP